MAGESAEAGLAKDQETTTTVSRLRGRMFELVSAGATLFGLTAVAILLLYVANDAFRLFSADVEWVVVFVGALGIPTIGLTAYYLVTDRTAWKVAYESTGILLASLVFAGGLVILFEELTTPQGWFALVVALGVGASVVSSHAHIRPEAALERLFVSIFGPVIAVFGIPAVAVDHTLTLPFSGTELFTVAFSTPTLLPSVRDIVSVLPILPVGWILLVATISVPTAYGFGSVVAARRGDNRGRYELVAGSVGMAMIGALVAPIGGISPETGVLLTSAVVIPTGAYLEGVLRTGQGRLGLLFPIVLLAGGVAAVGITSVLNFTGPNAWLDWGFLTSAHSRTPEDAGIYPALVGSVLIVLVIALSAFPVGVGAAIYLEEYAPSSGRFARFVELIEINIGNLAGVPSIVYGLLGLALFVQGIGLKSGIAIVGGLTVGLLILPIVIISAQEAVRAVPDSRRQASYAMGATRWQTVRNVVFPEALPGILTGTILALGRAIGETAPLLMIGIAASVRSPPSGFFSKTGAMPRQIFSWSSEIQPEFRTGVLAAGVIVLVVVLLVMNGTAIILRNRYQRSK